MTKSDPGGRRAKPDPLAGARAARPEGGVSQPQQSRAHATRERLLDVAGELLGEVGIERISTNLICARAGVTPPALYRYFNDKYAVLEALAQRLMDRQNVVLIEWLEHFIPLGLDVLGESLEALLRGTASVTAAEPGAIWILRALHAVPQLTHIRIASHRYVTTRLAEAYAPLLPDYDPDLLWRRLRISVEFGFATDEMLTEEDLIPREDLIRDAAAIIRRALDP